MDELTLYIALGLLSLLVLGLMLALALMFRKINALSASSPQAQPQARPPAPNEANSMMPEDTHDSLFPEQETEEEDLPNAPARPEPMSRKAQEHYVPSFNSLLFALSEADPLEEEPHDAPTPAAGPIETAEIAEPSSSSEQDPGQEQVQGSASERPLASISSRAPFGEGIMPSKELGEFQLVGPEDIGSISSLKNSFELTEEPSDLTENTATYKPTPQASSNPVPLDQQTRRIQDNDIDRLMVEQELATGLSSPSEFEINRLFQEYQSAAKKHAQRKVLDYESFASAVRAKRKQLQNKGAEQVAMSVQLQDGKVRVNISPEGTP